MAYPWCSSPEHDAFGEVDLSGGSRVSGQVGCMVRRLAALDDDEARLLLQLEHVRRARQVATDALDRFLAGADPDLRPHLNPTQAD